jgi:hypothetical protein
MAAKVSATEKRRAWIDLWWKGAEVVMQHGNNGLAIHSDAPKLLADLCDRLVASLIERVPPESE